MSLHPPSQKNLGRNPRSPARLLRFPSYAVRQRLEPQTGSNKNKEPGEEPTGGFWDFGPQNELFENTFP